MTIQIPNVGTGVPADQTGDSPWLAMKKVADNFSNTSHAANRLVGTAQGNVMEVAYATYFPSESKPLAVFSAFGEVSPNDTSNAPSYQHVLNMPWVDGTQGAQLLIRINSSSAIGFRQWQPTTQKWGEYREIYHKGNVTRDANGFLKGASPVVDLYDGRIELNYDAKEQGGITYEKLGVGDYLVKGSLGFAQEGWYIETPKDANGNVLVAVVYEQLPNNDLSIKTYAKKFDDETGDIVANLAKPRDIPVGRFISLRLHELPKEPPVMPTETQPEV